MIEVVVFLTVDNCRCLKQLIVGTQRRQRGPYGNGQYTASETPKIVCNQEINAGKTTETF